MCLQIFAMLNSLLRFSFFTIFLTCLLASMYSAIISWGVVKVEYRYSSSWLGFVQVRAEAALLTELLYTNFIPIKLTFRYSFFIFLYCGISASLASFQSGHKFSVMKILSCSVVRDRPRINKKKILYILEKNYINKTCRSCFEKMCLFVKIFCQP